MVSKRKKSPAPRKDADVMVVVKEDGGFVVADKAKEALRIALATAVPIDSRIPEELSPERIEQARFAARSLVGGRVILVSDDSIKAMAELIVGSGL